MSARGFRITVVHFTYSTDTYITSESDPVRHSLAALRTRVDGVHTVATPGSLIGRVAMGAYHLRRIVRGVRPSAVLTLYGGTNAAVAWSSGIRPYIVYVVGSDVLLASGVRRLASRAALRHAAVVLANGQHLAESARKLAPGARVQPLYLGIDTARFRPPSHRARAPHFVCTRGFGHLYDNATIVRAMAALSDPPADFRMCFVSGGPELARSIALADELIAPPARANVEFVGGTSRDGLLDTLDWGSFYLSASVSDGASISLLEALACGLFPIVSDIPANREWIVHGENGLLFPVGDHVELARCIEQALAGIPWMATALQTNRSLVLERAELDASMTRLAGVVEQHLPRQSGHRSD